MGVGPALTGDLCERYARGRSRFWFWRQTFLAVAIGTINNIRDHKFLFVRAALVGIFAINVLSYGVYAVAPLVIDVAPVRHPLTFQVLGFAVLLMGGWVVGRFHRPYSGSIILGLVVLAWLFQGPQLVRNISNLMQHERFRPYVIAWALNRTTAAIALLAGGILSARPAPREDQPSVRQA